MYAVRIVCYFVAHHLLIKWISKRPADSVRTLAGDNQLIGGQLGGRLLADIVKEMADEQLDHLNFQNVRVARHQIPRFAVTVELVDQVNWLYSHPSTASARWPDKL